jgi:octaprenyl-diphosphate synthase
VGDYFMSGALNEGVRTESIEIVRALSELGKELSLGEIHQICNARGHQFRIDDYYTAIRKKTASLFMQCARVGAEAVNAPAALSAALVQYAELLGQCFQIRDDIFDYFPSHEVGKPSGNDLREGKVTLPLLHALRTAPEAEASNAKELIARGSLTEQEIESLISFAKKHRGIEFAYAEMERLHAEALPLLLSYPDSATRDSLAGLFAFIIARNS